MKKILYISMMIFGLIVFSGCGKIDEKDVLKELAKKINESSSYNVKGQLEIINSEYVYEYDVDVAYQKEENFRVSLKNKTNNHEQIILKNKEGVFV